MRCEKLYGVARGLQFRCIEAGLTKQRRVTGCEQQCVALAQRNLKGLRESEDHLAARLRAPSLNATEMTGRDLRIERKVQLAETAESAPTT
jgi:hypothetical protein